MRVSYSRKLRDFWETAQYADAEQALKSWFHEVKNAEWTCWADLRSQYGSADWVGGRVVFNIRGNKYRLVVHFNFQAQMASIRFIGTHEQYDKIEDISEI